MKALLVLTALLWAQPMLADDLVPSDAEVAALVSVIEARGCVLTDKDDETVLTDSKLSQDQAHAVVAKLLADGDAAIIDDHLHLTTGTCAASATDTAKTETAKPVADRASLIALIEANGCKMTEEEAGTMLPPAGFTQDDTLAIVDALKTEGLAVVDQTGITLKTENCP